MQENFKPWYVGWKICYKKLSDILKQFYEMPSFLPKAWMLDRNEWIFMGTPGFGAHSHLDYMGVQKVTWVGGNTYAGPLVFSLRPI